MATVGEVRGNARFLGFGFTLTLGSAFGQTFFVALFGEPIRRELQLSHGDWGTVYSLATVGSAITVIWVGRLIDTVDLRAYAACVLVGLAAACASMSLPTSAAALVLTLYLMRLFGQGLMSHTASTSMARYFEQGRGKAMALASLGFAAGEGLLPRPGLALVEAVGWRTAWLIVAGVVLTIFLPVALWLLRGHAERHRRHLEERSTPRPASEPPPIADWTRAEVLRDPRYYALLAASLAPPFILTGFFFHQEHIVGLKGWGMELFTTCYLGFATAKVLTTLAFGPLVDRFTARRLAPVFLVPLGIGLALFSQSSSPATAWLFMILAGATAGAQTTIVGTLWPEIYGVAHLGGIRAMSTAAFVVSTALAPITFGMLLDEAVPSETLALGCLAWTVVGTVLLAATPLRQVRTPAGTNL